jgi:hypothetical protein
MIDADNPKQEREAGYDAEEERAALREAAMERLMPAVEHQPQSGDWGYFIRDETGIGAIFWFVSRDEMLTAIARDHVAICELPITSDLTVLEAQVRALIAPARMNCDDDSRVRADLNTLLKGYMEIEWWGMLPDLTEGSSEFARDVRTSFRENVRTYWRETTADDGQEEVISADEHLAFIQWLPNCGL